MSESTDNDKILRDILRKAGEVADKIGAPKSGLPVIRSGPDDKAYYYIEMNSEGINLVYKERSFETSRRITDDPEEVLYHLVEGLTAGVAYRFARENRVRGQDYRRIWFRKQEELMQELNPVWWERSKKEHEAIFKDNPFEDILRPTIEDIRKYQGGKCSYEDPSKTLTSYSMDGSEDIVSSDIYSSE
jgi:hypothetical protein